MTTPPQAASASGTRLAVPLDLTLVPASCDGCGLCCQGIGSPVLVYSRRPGGRGPWIEPPHPLPSELQRELDEAFGGLSRGIEPQQQCLWYDEQSQRCRHYELRPQVCRDYELASRQCLSRRRSELKALVEKLSEP